MGLVTLPATITMLSTTSRTKNMKGRSAVNFWTSPLRLSAAPFEAAHFTGGKGNTRCKTQSSRNLDGNGTQRLSHTLGGELTRLDFNFKKNLCKSCKMYRNGENTEFNHISPSVYKNMKCIYDSEFIIDAIHETNSLHEI